MASGPARRPDMTNLHRGCKTLHNTVGLYMHITLRSRIVISPSLSLVYITRQQIKALGQQEGNTVSLQYQEFKTVLITKLKQE